MSSEQLADGVNPLDAELAATWDILKGYSGRDTDLGIGRRFGGAAAAYSLRDIGAMNGSVVRVRREPEDTTDGIDDEEKFSANQVQSGALEDWVNGKLESTLPADVDTAAATYSLRKAKADYSGDAVRIRRSSDDVEVNVALDSDDKVSTSSSISVVSGSTSATDLNEFLNETLTVGVAVEGGSGADRPDSFTNATNSSFTATVTGIAGGYFPYKSAAGDAVTVSFDLVLSVGSSPSLNTSLGVSTVATRAAGTAYNSSGSYTFTLNCNDSADHIRFADGDDGTFSVTNFRVVSHTHSAFVHTWYDQAGSNDAVQATAANQPKIAESGALLADGLDFDGVDDYLEVNGLSSIYTGTDKAHSSFVVVNSDAATTTQYILGIGSSTDGNPIRNTLFHSGGNIGWQVRDDAGTLKSDLTANPYVANQTYLVSALNSGTTIDFNTNSVINDNGTDADVGASTIDTVHIGTRANSPTGYLNGSIQELVFYASDQSANRFKIESNINNYYGLYNDANEFASDETAFRFLNERSGGTSASSNLTQYTLDVQTASAYAGAKFASNVNSGDSIFVSFNASLDEGSFTASPKVGLRNIDSFLNGTLYSNEGEVTEGFNSFQLTSTNSAASGIVWSEGDDNVIFTISDFKVSRIARNGFVETWYDQSGNGNDAVQASAGNQPAIVQNGGLVTDGIRFETDNELETGGNITASTITGFVVANLKGTNANSLYSLGSDSSAAPSVLFGNPSLSYAINGGTPLAGGTAPTFANSLFTQLFISGGTSKSFIDGSQIASGDAGSNTASSGKITIGNLASSTRYANIAMNELIVFISDKSTDQDEIEKDIANFYNITLS